VRKCAAKNKYDRTTAQQLSRCYVQVIGEMLFEIICWPNSGRRPGLEMSFPHDF